ncbi:MAG: divergent polysaccharide deacetylase family protein [Pseudomonadota bacterium]
MESGAVFNNKGANRRGGLIGSSRRDAIGRQYGDPDDAVWRAARLGVYILIVGSMVGLIIGRIVAPASEKRPIFELPYYSPAAAPAAEETAALRPWRPTPFAPIPAASLAVAERKATIPTETAELANQAGESAAPPSINETGPQLAILIDDVGARAAAVGRVLELPQSISLSLLSNAVNVERVAERAGARGFELWLHLPMEPLGPQNPGPMALRASHSAAELNRLLDWHLGRFDGFVGVNNHMGSRLTANRAAMDAVMARISEADALYVDSLTSQRSVALRTARDWGVTAAPRAVFLDHDPRPGAIRAAFRRAEAAARRDGAAIAIMHPHNASLSVLEDWLAGDKAADVQLSTASAVVRRLARPSGGKFVVAAAR